MARLEQHDTNRHVKPSPLSHIFAAKKSQLTGTIRAGGRLCNDIPARKGITYRGGKILRSRRNRSSGQMLVMGTVDFLIATITLVGCLVLIICCSMVAMAKQQVLYAAQIGAKISGQFILADKSGDYPGAGAYGCEKAKELLKRIAPALTNVHADFKFERRAHRNSTKVTPLNGVYLDISYFKLTIAADCNVPGAGWLPGATHLEQSAIVYVPTMPLLAIPADGKNFVDPYQPSSPDRTVWLPIVTPSGSARKQWLYKEIVDGYLCKHRGLAATSPVRPQYAPLFVYPNNALPAGLKDPR
jgi:hypothetical protein